jgi:hypothetical protein
LLLVCIPSAKTLAAANRASAANDVISLILILPFVFNFNGFVLVSSLAAHVRFERRESWSPRSKDPYTSIQTEGREESTNSENARFRVYSERTMISSGQKIAVGLAAEEWRGFNPDVSGCASAD